MSKDQPLQSRDAIRVAALASGLDRSCAWVFAIIGYWSQIKGGTAIGSGPKWQWRNYDEIASEIGYSRKTVGKAVGRLTDLGLIEVKRIWNPSRPGQNVNAFRLTETARDIFNLKIPKEQDQLSQEVIAEKEPSSASDEKDALVPMTHGEVAMIKEPSLELQGYTAIDSHASESMAAANPILKWFGDEFTEGVWWDQLSDEHVTSFWLGYKQLIEDVFGHCVGLINAKRKQWLSDYLKMFRSEGYSPSVAADALILICQNWNDFAAVLSSYEGKPDFIKKFHPDPYTLGVFPHVILDFWKWYDS
jgi:DNA-binding transcriptional regulator GbsR (MarR family)